MYNLTGTGIGKLIVLIFTVVISVPCFSQQKNNHIYNNHIKYEIETTRDNLDSTGTKYAPSKCFVIIKFNKKLQEQITKLRYSDIMELLSEDRTDWATNLILYCIYEKDAFMLLNTKRATWVTYLKADDIKYWKEFLLDPNNFKKLSTLDISQLGIFQ